VNLKFKQPESEWMHLAQTQTRWSVKCYINGRRVSKRVFARESRGFNMLTPKHRQPLFV
jgi:hypothetical protein